MSRLRAVWLVVCGLAATSTLAATLQHSRDLESSAVVLHDDRLLQDYVAGIGGNVAGALAPERPEPEPRFVLARDPEPRARSLADGTLVVNAGLLAALDNESQLAAAVAAELTRRREWSEEESAERFVRLLLDAGFDAFEAPRARELLGGGMSLPARLDVALERLRAEGLLVERERQEVGEYASRVRRLRRDCAILDYETGERGRAERTLRLILLHDAGDAMSHLYLGKILWDEGGVSSTERALAELRLAAELAPSLAEPHRELGYVYESLGYRDSAAAAFERYLELSPRAEDGPDLRSHLDSMP